MTKPLWDTAREIRYIGMMQIYPGQKLTWKVGVIEVGWIVREWTNEDGESVVTALCRICRPKRDKLQKFHFINAYAWEASVEVGN